jgi:hypothetical protein
VPAAGSSSPLWWSDDRRQSLLGGRSQRRCLGDEKREARVLADGAAGRRPATAEADDRRGRSRGLRLRGQIKRADQQVERRAVLLDRVVVEPRQTAAAVGHVAGDGDLVGNAGIAAAAGDPLTRAGKLPDLDTFGDGALGGLDPSLRGCGSMLPCLHLLSHQASSLPETGCRVKASLPSLI